MNSGSGIREKSKFILNGRAGLNDYFFLFRQGEEEGPYSFEELEELHGSGKISSATPCRSRSAREWQDLAYLLKEAPDEQRLDPAEKSSAQDPPATTQKVEPMNKLVMDLIALSRRQNQLLASIKWGIAALAAVSLAVWVTVVLYVV